MNMQKTLKISGLMALSLGLVLAATQADARGRRGQGGGQGGHGGMHKGMMRALDLSAEQRTEMEKLRLDMQQDTLELRASLRQKHEELRALWMVDEPSEKAIMAKHRQIEPLQKKLRNQHIKFRLAAHQLLTPEQRSKMADMSKRGRRGGKGCGMGGRGMGGGMGGQGGPGMMGM